MDLTVAEQFYLLKKIQIQKKEELLFYYKGVYEVKSCDVNFHTNKIFFSMQNMQVKFQWTFSTKYTRKRKIILSVRCRSNFN